MFDNANVALNVDYYTKLHLDIHNILQCGVKQLTINILVLTLINSLSLISSKHRNTKHYIVSNKAHLILIILMELSNFFQHSQFVIDVGC